MGGEGIIGHTSLELAATCEMDLRVSKRLYTGEVSDRVRGQWLPISSSFRLKKFCTTFK